MMTAEWGDNEDVGENKGEEQYKISANKKFILDK